MYPTVTIGCPIRDREKYLPYYLKCIYELEYPKKLITLLFVENDSTDATYSILSKFREEHKTEYYRIKLLNYNQGTPKDARITQIRYEHTYHALSRLRNYWMAQVKTDYALNVDSDIMVESYTLAVLVADNKDYVSGLIINGYEFYGDDNPERCNNILLADETGCFLHILKYPIGLVEVQVTGALFLISKRALKDGHFSWNAQGEDIPYCKSLLDKGYKIYCDTTVKATHCMNEQYLEKYIKGEFHYV